MKYVRMFWITVDAHLHSPNDLFEFESPSLPAAYVNDNK